MSQIIENTIVYANSDSENVKSIIRNCSIISNFNEIHKDDVYTLAIFDSNGNTDYDEEGEKLLNVCFLKESGYAEDMSVETMCKGGDEITPLTVSYLIKSGFLFKKLDSDERERLLTNIEYNMGLELCQI